MKPNHTNSRSAKKQLTLALSILLTFLAVACGTQNTTTKIQPPTQAMATATNSNLTEIGEGHAIYMRHCSQCHEPKLPHSPTSESWHIILPDMAWNAGLSSQQQKQVTAYIKAAVQYPNTPTQ